MGSPPGSMADSGGSQTVMLVVDTNRGELLATLEVDKGWCLWAPGD